MGISLQSVQNATTPCSIFRIPDLVKDPEAEAAFEGLRGLLEASLHRDYEKQQALKKEAKLHQKKSTDIQTNDHQRVYNQQQHGQTGGRMNMFTMMMMMRAICHHFQIKTLHQKSNNSQVLHQKNVNTKTHK